MIGCLKWEKVILLEDFFILLSLQLVFLNGINSKDLHAGNMNGLPMTTWRGLLGAALSSYHKLLLVNTSRNSEFSFFLSLAKSHSTCPQVLSAVAEYLDSLQG